MTRRLDPQKIPPPVRNVGEILTSHGFQAYLVGGSVRDLLLGDVPSDFTSPPMRALGKSRRSFLTRFRWEPPLARS